MGDTIAKHYETHLSARNREQDYNTQLGLTPKLLCVIEPILHMVYKPIKTVKLKT